MSNCIMKEFRIARCLDGDGISEYAIFADGSRKKRICTDDKGRKYFEVDNELNNSASNRYERRIFTDRIKDAVETIRMGNGDCIKLIDFFGRHEKVIYYLDRSIGEEFRKKSITGWKDAKFGWVIKVGSKNSFYGYQMLAENFSTISPFDGDKTPMYFESEEDAKKHIEMILNKSKYLAEKLSNELSGISDKRKKEEIFGSLLEEIEDYAGVRFSVVEDFVFDMYENIEAGFELKNMGHSIIQCVVK